MDEKKRLFLSLLESSNAHLTLEALRELATRGTGDRDVLSAVVDILAGEKYTASRYGGTFGIMR